MRIEEGLDAARVEEVELFAVDDEVQGPVSISCLTGGSSDLVDARNVHLADESDDNATTVGNGVDLEMSGFGFVGQEVPFEVMAAEPSQNPLFGFDREAGLAPTFHGYVMDH
jgi:hypothetical protein